MQHVNRTYRRSGTLWEGRFRSCLIYSEPYLLACQRHIELNPVRAAIVRIRAITPSRATGSTPRARRATSSRRMSSIAGSAGAQTPAARPIARCSMPQRTNAPSTAPGRRPTAASPSDPRGSHRRSPACWAGAWNGASTAGRLERARTARHESCAKASHHQTVLCPFSLNMVRPPIFPTLCF